MTVLSHFLCFWQRFRSWPDLQMRSKPWPQNTERYRIVLRTFLSITVSKNKNKVLTRVWSSFETFFESFEKSLVPEIKKTDVYFCDIKTVTQTQFEACVTAFTCNFYFLEEPLPQTLWRTNIMKINSSFTKVCWILQFECAFWFQPLTIETSS